MKWEFPDSYRQGRYEYGDYLMVISGERKYEFHWAVFFRGSEVLSSKHPCRSVPEAQRICEAIFEVHNIYIK